jgi:hypothetical protein
MTNALNMVSWCVMFEELHIVGGEIIQFNFLFAKFMDYNLGYILYYVVTIIQRVKSLSSPQPSKL